MFLNFQIKNKLMTFQHYKLSDKKYLKIFLMIEDLLIYESKFGKNKKISKNNSFSEFTLFMFIFFD